MESKQASYQIYWSQTCQYHGNGRKNNSNPKTNVPKGAEIIMNKIKDKTINLNQKNMVYFKLQAWHSQDLQITMMTIAYPQKLLKTMM
jgi:hypothetical protein